MVENCIKVDELQRVDFKDVKVLPGDQISSFYLDVTYEFENPYGIFELHIPRIRMDKYFRPHTLPNIKRETDEAALDSINGPYIDSVSLMNFGLFLKCDGCIDFEIKTIKEKVPEMTLEDIEKELGYKVKIVSGKKRR